MGPSLEARLSLVCAQLLVYHERFDLPRKAITLLRKVYLKTKGNYFHTSYMEKVEKEFVAAVFFEETNRKNDKNENKNDKDNDDEEDEKEDEKNDSDIYSASDSEEALELA